jgi:hypothetical protein
MTCRSRYRIRRFFDAGSVLPIKRAEELLATLLEDCRADHRERERCRR